MSPNLPERPRATASPVPSAAAAPPGQPVTAAAAGSTADGGATIGAGRFTLPAERGDLFAGSLMRKLPAGDRTLVIAYWTDADPATLSATTPTIVKLAARLEGGDSKNTVKVSRFLATADDGSTSTTLAEDRGEFVITPPYAYGTALTIRPSNPTTTSVGLSIQFELLVETAPGSGAYFRQTVLDTVRVALPATVRGTQS